MYLISPTLTYQIGTRAVSSPQDVEDIDLIEPTLTHSLPGMIGKHHRASLDYHS